MDSELFSNIGENERLYFRLKFERVLHELLYKTHQRNGVRRALFLLKESPSLLAGFIERYEKKYENVLLSEQKGNCY